LRSITLQKNVMEKHGWRQVNVTGGVMRRGKEVVRRSSICRHFRVQRHITEFRSQKVSCCLKRADSFLRDERCMKG
jgi:hypothetical protein